MNCGCNNQSDCQFRIVRDTGGRLFELCSGNNCTREQSDKYRKEFKRREIVRTQKPARAERSVKERDEFWLAELPCGHRQEIVRQDKCDTCGDRGKAFDVYGCHVHGECSILKRQRKIQSCYHCDFATEVGESPTATVDWESFASERIVCGVTTSPRKSPTLPACIDSMTAAGFNPIVFAEPGSPATKQPTIQHATKQGPWYNWLGMCRTLLKNTNSQWIMTVQDDSLFHSGSRLFLESFGEHHQQSGFLSLYTPKHYAAGRELGSVFPISTKSLWGACALAFPRESLAAIVSHSRAANWKGAVYKVGRNRQRQRWEVANVDTAIGIICTQLKLPMIFCNPSLVQHVAVHSTLGHGGNKGKRNCDPCADLKVDIGEIYEACCSDAV